MPEILDHRICTLGEGPLWHPQRQQLFWFDIIGRKMLSRTESGESWEWPFERHVSAAGWIDSETLLIASETELLRFQLDTGVQETICTLEADNPLTRSNDGRADPWGGFWIGTMGKEGQPGAGAIYRYYRGELRRLFAPLTIPNAICFSPDRRYACFADTARGLIWRQALADRDGWPRGEPGLFVDCSKAGVSPDGAVIDQAGRLWNAQWGASRIACYDPDGRLVSIVQFPAAHISCPAFGGAELTTLYATSATEGLSPAHRGDTPHAGKTFRLDSVGAKGQSEYSVIP